MFQVGDLMVYGNNGVCRVEAIERSPLDEKDDRLFYRLHPTHDNANLVIYTPVELPEGSTMTMRPLISRERAEEVLAGLSKIEPVVVPQEKKRRDCYREVMADFCPEGCLSIIKSVAIRRREFMRTRRRLPDIDNDFERMARICFYGEIGHILGIPRDELEARVKAAFSAEPKDQE